MNKRMRSYIMLVMGCVGLLGIMGAVRAENKPGPELTLIADGASDYVIVVPDGEDVNNRVKKASDLLQSKLAEATGVKLPVVKEAEAPADKPHIYLGKTRAAAKDGVPVDTLKEWMFCKRVVGKDLFLAGLDASVSTNLPQLGYLGTLEAVTSFLEDEVGVRFLLPCIIWNQYASLPGTNGVYVPKLAGLKINAGLNVTAAPQLVQDIMIYKTYGGHSYYHAVPKKKYAETHPEYFALIGGKRVPPFDHLCISNPEVQELMLKEMEKQLDIGYEWVELGQTDGYNACQCDKCKAIAGDDVGEALWITHRKLAEQMKTRRPGKKIVILSYIQTAKPPKTFDRFSDNVVIEMCSYSPENFERWKKFNVDKIAYTYFWSDLYQFEPFPKRSPAYVGKEMRLLAENNVKSVYVDCGWSYFGLEGPVYYVFGKLLCDPSADPQKLADDFYRAAYGKAAGPMKVFFDALHKRLDFGGASAIDVLPKMPEEQVCCIFTPGLILLMDENLKRAFEMENDPGVQARLRLVRREFDYLKTTTLILTCYRAYRLSGSQAVFDLLEAGLDNFKALIDSWFVENEAAKTDPKAPKWKMKMDGGFYTFSRRGNNNKDFFKHGTGYSGLLSGPPFTWDMKKMRETKQLVGAGFKTKSLKAARLTQAPTMNGVPDEEAWKKAAGDELSELGMGTLKEGTSFKVGYDDANVYFAFTCKYSDIEQAKFMPCGRDGACWILECLEIFIDPFGTREKKYHFIFNPVPESCYDERAGFIDDPRHPMFGKEDKSWNGAWEYAAKVDKANKCWTAEVKIPFATLGVPTPQPGTKWTMDVARGHYYTNKDTGKTDVEYSSWSPNLEERAFGKLNGFGNLEFE